MQKEKCPLCESKEVIQEEYELICKKCGCVLRGPPPSFVNGKKIYYPQGLFIE